MSLVPECSFYLTKLFFLIWEIPAEIGIFYLGQILKKKRGQQAWDVLSAKFWD